MAFGLATFLAWLAGVWLAVGAHPGHGVALWTALPLLIAGLGGGLVIDALLHTSAYFDRRRTVRLSTI